MNRAALLMQLARMAARGAGKMKPPPSYLKHTRQSTLPKGMSTRREGVGRKQESPEAPIQQSTSPYTNRLRQKTYNRRSPLGKALMDMGETTLHGPLLDRRIFQPPPHPIYEAEAIALARAVKKLLDEDGSGNLGPALRTSYGGGPTPPSR